jgi:SAM-dependent methyltransferase
MLKKLKIRLRRESYLPSPLGIVISPFYIIRNGLYKGVLSHASKIEGDILDFGCGSKPYESLFIKAKSYIGVDMQASGYDHKDSKIDFCYDGKVIPLPDDSFDAVVCFEVLEHIFNIEEVLGEIRRVLKPNGQILISIPFAWNEHLIPHDFARYTSYGIRHVLEKNGFSVVEITKSTTYFLAVCQMFIAYLSQHVSPESRIPAKLFQIVFIFPLTVISLFLDRLLPKRYEYFCDSIVLGKKPSIENRPEKAA